MLPESPPQVDADQQKGYHYQSYSQAKLLPLVFAPQLLPNPADGFGNIPCYLLPAVVMWLRFSEALVLIVDLGR